MRRDRVQIDVVRHGVAGVVHQMQLNKIAATNAHHRSWNGAAEGPEGVVDTVRDFARDLAHLNVHNDLGWRMTLCRRRSRGWYAERCLHNRQRGRVDGGQRRAMPGSGRNRWRLSRWLRVGVTARGEEQTCERASQDNVDAEKL